MPKRDNLSTVRIHEDLAKTIDEIIKSDIGKKYGFRSRADFVTRACREYIEEVHPRFEHVNMMDDNVKVVDYTQNRIATIYFRDEGQVRCDLCNAIDCEHIAYALAQPSVQEELKKHDWERAH
jgi:metal-responsive CopG/Arc/MetJ family transcriptional regulator